VCKIGQICGIYVHIYFSAQPVLGYSESSAGLYSSGYLEAGYFLSYAELYSSGYLGAGYFES
jgi:hypothetical protein